MLKMLSSKERWLAYFIFLVFVFPIILISFYSYRTEKRELTAATLARRESIAYLSAYVLKTRFDQLIEVGKALSSRDKARKLVQKGRWKEAMELFQEASKDFPMVERLLLADLEGTLKADFPLVPSIQGKNFAFRDWYQGAKRHWKPYVSRVYQRKTFPHNIISVAIPVKTDKDKVIALLVLQVPLDTLVAWSKEVEVGTDSYVYFVDHRGIVAASPLHSPQGELVDYSSVPIVQKALQGFSGVEETYSPIEQEMRVAAYAPVPGYGWGAIVSQKGEVAYDYRDNSLRRLLIVYTTVCVISGLLAYLLVLLIEHQRRETILQEKGRQLVALSQVKSEFASMVSHELRTPLTSIREGIALTLEGVDGPVNEAQKEVLTISLNNVDRLARLINNVLDYTRLEAGKLEMVFENNDINELIREVYRLMKLEVDKAGIRFSLELPQEPLFAVCDSDKIQQVLINLVHNALKFTPQGGEITIRLKAPSDSQVMISVEDTGTGIHKEDQEKIFQMFTQASYRGMWKTGGSGIGLAVCKLIMDHHQGKITVQSEPGHGSRFTLFLPFSTE